jgi:hypothetical protein
LRSFKHAFLLPRNSPDKGEVFLTASGSPYQKPTEWQRIGNQIDAAMICARADLRKLREDVNSMVNEIDPRQPFLRVNILRWREIFRMIETSSRDVDLIGAFVVLIGQRRSTATAERPARSCLRPISTGRSFLELELRAFYCDPGYCLSSGGSPAVCTMTIRPDTDLGRRAETHLATITATGDFILFHVSHCKLGMSDRNRDNLLVSESRKHVQEIIAHNLSKAGWSLGWMSAVDCEGRTIWIADAHRGDGKRFVARAGEKLTAFVELQSAICPATVELSLL